MAAPEAAATASVVGGGEHDLPIEEVDALLASFSPSPETEAGTSREGLVEIERFLMDDMDEAAVDGTAVEVDAFLDAILVGHGESNGVPDPAGGGSVGGASAGEDEEVVGVDDDDLDSKKKMRQVRNRDSAMKSRERKKLYVKDLEMKSKYLEAECCRLSYTLQCCAAENVALRRCLLKDRPVGAPTAMQESAVLTETLPLVSLLSLVCIVYLFLMPGVPNRSLVAPSRPERDSIKLVRMVTIGVKMIRMTRNCAKMIGMTTNGDPRGTSEIICHGRRCKGRRAKNDNKSECNSCFLGCLSSCKPALSC
ncbi:hypothetical protein QOZ80_2AG0104820 [Eleusine coracana subsp. coracana]|nr:hypothetical protein QOZ80_2AG0104820 [Eleusine coracana subsp. coracana]